MDIRQLKNFLILCETLNFRQASGQINIVQPALSKQIQALENELGALLFNRSKRSVTLTEAGIFFQKEVNRILQDLNKTIARTAQLHTGEAGDIKVTHASSAMNTVVPSFLARLKHTWPNLKTIVQETSNFQQIEMLLKGNRISASLPISCCHRKSTQKFSTGKILPSFSRMTILWQKRSSPISLS